MSRINLFKIFVVLVSLHLTMPTFAVTNQDTASYMYISLKGDNKVALYSLNTKTGVPTIIYSETVPGGPASLAMHPTKKYLYVAQRSAKTISAYSINSLTGKLTFINTIAAVDDPVYVSTDKTGKYLLTAYYSANKAAVYEINTDGSLKSAAIKTITTGTNPHLILTDNSNQYLYIPNMTGNQIEQFSFNATTGEFNPLTPAYVTPPAGTCPRHMTFHGSKNITYVVNEVNNTVTAYKIGQTDGTLTAFQNITTLPAGFTQYSKCADIHITPDNKFVYASNRGHQSIVAYAINENTDTLTTVGYYYTTVSPREFDLDPTGSFLYSAGETNGDLSYYKINKQTGALDSITTLAVGKTPSWVLTVQFINTSTSSVLLEKGNPSPFNLHNYPNPFQSKTNISYTLEKPEAVLLQIFSMEGQLITTLQDGKGNKGQNIVTWDMNRFPGKGAYICCLQSKENQDKNQIVILRN